MLGGVIAHFLHRIQGRSFSFLPPDDEGGRGGDGALMTFNVQAAPGIELAVTYEVGTLLLLLLLPSAKNLGPGT